MLKERFNFLLLGRKNDKTPNIFLILGLMNCMRTCAWEQACKEQDNYDKAAYLAISFFPQEGDYQFAKKWLFRKPNKFFDFLSSQLK